MEKLVYGLWRRPDQDPAEIGAALLEEVAPRLLELGVDGLRVQVEEPAGRVLRTGALPDGSLLCGSVSLWLDSCDHRGPHEAALAAAGATAHGWIVAESVPKAYGEHRRWPDGERSPGMSLITFPACPTRTSTGSGTASTRRSPSTSTRSGSTCATRCCAR